MILLPRRSVTVVAVEICFAFPLKSQLFRAAHEHEQRDDDHKNDDDGKDAINPRQNCQLRQVFEAR